jgi:hypothetical protein
MGVWKGVLCVFASWTCIDCAVLMVVVYNIPCLELSADILAMDLFGGVA